MDAGFDENEAELRVFVFSVALEMFANSDSLLKINHLPSSWAKRERLKSYLLDQHVEVLGYLWGEAYCLKSLRQSKTKQRQYCIVCAVVAFTRGVPYRSTSGSEEFYYLQPSVSRRIY